MCKADHTKLYLVYGLHLKVYTESLQVSVGEMWNRLLAGVKERESIGDLLNGTQTATKL